MGTGAWLVTPLNEVRGASSIQIKDGKLIWSKGLHSYRNLAQFCLETRESSNVADQNEIRTQIYIYVDIIPVNSSLFLPVKFDSLRSNVKIEPLEKSYNALSAIATRHDGTFM